MVLSAPLYTLPNKLVGWAKVPKGRPANEVVENSGPAGCAAAPVPGSPSGVLLFGSRESVLLQPRKVATRAQNAGARKRATRRDNLKLWSIRRRSSLSGGYTSLASGEGPSLGTAKAAAHRGRWI